MTNNAINVTFSLFSLLSFTPRWYISEWLSLLHSSSYQSFILDQKHTPIKIIKGRQKKSTEGSKRKKHIKSSGRAFQTQATFKVLWYLDLLNWRPAGVTTVQPPRQWFLAHYSGWLVCHGGMSTTSFHRGRSWVKGGIFQWWFSLYGIRVESKACFCVFLTPSQSRRLQVKCRCHWAVLQGEGGRRIGGRS